MKYRLDKYGNKLSALGYGCMRFTSTAGRVDVDKTEKEIMAAYNAGVNYYDTAYVYPGSEDALGQILSRNNIRDKVNIATKLPHYLIKSHDSLDKFFSEELRRLRTDHVDYYLMHMLTDTATWERLKALGIVEWIEEKKASGAIRQIGFSYHGNSDMFCELVDAYDWDFCQIQYNYMDEHSQAGRKGLHTQTPRVCRSLSWSRFAAAGSSAGCPPRRRRFLKITPSPILRRSGRFAGCGTSRRSRSCCRA